MGRWLQKQNRKRTGKTVMKQVSRDLFERNRYFVRTIVEVLQFLIINELPTRDNSNIDGLFQMLFHFAVTKDDRLRSIYSQIPKNAKYTLPKLQNEIRVCMADITTNKIVNDIASSPCFVIRVDETRDKQGVEDLAIGCRFVPSGSSCIVERYIVVTALSKQNAAAITKSIFMFWKNFK